MLSRRANVGEAELKLDNSKKIVDRSTDRIENLLLTIGSQDPQPKVSKCKIQSAKRFLSTSTL